MGPGMAPAPMQGPGGGGMSAGVPPGVMPAPMPPQGVPLGMGPGGVLEGVDASNPAMAAKAARKQAKQVRARATRIARAPPRLPVSTHARLGWTYHLPPLTRRRCSQPRAASQKRRPGTATTPSAAKRPRK